MSDHPLEIHLAPQRETRRGHIVVAVVSSGIMFLLVQSWTHFEKNEGRYLSGLSCALDRFAGYRAHYWDGNPARAQEIYDAAAASGDCVGDDFKAAKAGAGAARLARADRVARDETLRRQYLQLAVASLKEAVDASGSHECRSEEVARCVDYLSALTGLKDPEMTTTAFAVLREIKKRWASVSAADKDRLTLLESELRDRREAIDKATTEAALNLQKQESAAALKRLAEQHAAERNESVAQLKDVIQRYERDLAQKLVRQRGEHETGIRRLQDEVDRDRAEYRVVRDREVLRPFADMENPLRSQFVYQVPRTDGMDFPQLAVARAPTPSPPVIVVRAPQKQSGKVRKRPGQQTHAAVRTSRPAITLRHCGEAVFQSSADITECIHWNGERFVVGRRR